MQTETVEPPRVAEYIRQNCPDLFSEALETGSLTMRLHDDLPTYGVGLVDDRLAICWYDDEGTSVRVLVDNAETAVQDWAGSVYESYWRQTPTVPLNSVEE